MNTELSISSPATRRVLVLGAHGRLGAAVVRAFAAAGWGVVAHTRRIARQPWPEGVQGVQCDALDTAALQRAGAGCSVVVNGLSPDYTQWDRLLPPLTAATLALARALNARLMLPGNVYVYGQQLPALLKEDTPVAGNHPKARQRIAMEAAMADAAARGVRSVVIRAGDFLGDQGTWVDLAMAKRLARGRWVHMGPDDVAHAWAFLPDLARVFVAVAERDAALPAFTTLHYPGINCTGAQMQTAVEGVVGHKLLRSGFPWWLMRLAAPFAAMPRALLEMRHLWQRPHRLDGTRLAALIGPLPATPLAEVMRLSLGAGGA
ncbi:nucleoside-diphosphate-sugar epimerase [Burkholderiales bacterium JOSHI_001]|nr:nucleoside-diphosphate-sugar epimerase [Burkholderiales bacterium JOSHI_001]